MRRYKAGRAETVIGFGRSSPKIRTKARLSCWSAFIGTGETAVKGINDILSKVADRNRIYVIALVAQNVGIEAIESLGIRIYADVIRFKGISDYYKDEELIEKINLMEAIERKLAIKRKYRFGYGASEALVTMKRTPNNTFPVFWEENDRANKAPFPRL